MWIIHVHLIGAANVLLICASSMQGFKKMKWKYKNLRGNKVYKIISNDFINTNCQH